MIKSQRSSLIFATGFEFFPLIFNEVVDRVSLLYQEKKVGKTAKF